MPLLDRDGARLAYDVQGDGPTIVLTAGYGVPAALWGPLVPALASSFRVVTHDVRGFGKTEVTREKTTLDELSDDLHAIVEAVGGPVLSAGHAFGGAVTANHAVRHPADVRGVVLMSAGGMFASDPAAAANMLPLATKRDLDAEGYAKLFCETYAGAGFGETPEQQEFLKGMFEATQSREQARAAVSALVSMNADAYWGQWTQPTLLLYGTHDRIAVPLNAFDLARRPGYELHWLRGAGHFSPMERPQQIAARIGEWAAGFEDGGHIHRSR